MKADSNPRQLWEAFSQFFPVEHPEFHIELLEPEEWWSEGGDLMTLVRTFIWDVSEPDDMRTIREIKEQRVLLVPARYLEHFERVLLYAEGMALALSQEVIRGTNVETWMPMDFFFPRVLELKRPRSAEDFARALSVPSRLGRLWSES